MEQRNPGGRNSFLSSLQCKLKVKKNNPTPEWGRELNHWAMSELEDLLETSGQLSPKMGGTAFPQDGEMPFTLALLQAPLMSHEQRVSLSTPRSFHSSFLPLLLGPPPQRPSLTFLPNTAPPLAPSTFNLYSLLPFFIELVITWHHAMLF